MLILLWGLEAEGPLAAVGWELHRLGMQTALIDQCDVLGTEIDLTAGPEVSGWISTRGRRIDLTAVTAVYARPYDSRSLRCVVEADTNGRAVARAAMVDDLMSAWSQITPALVVNRTDAMAANNSKPYQLQMIRDLGFQVPATLVTTDPQAAEAFWQHHGTVIYKSVSGTRSQVSRLRHEHRRRLPDVAACPTQFQQHIAGRDHRVHVVGREVFACELICDADDYRYPEHHPLEIRTCRLPSDVEDRCRLLASAMRLPLAGVDLRRTPGGEWYCFEVNPSPAFTYYEQATGQPLTNAVARLLSGDNAVQAIATSAGIVEPVAWNV